MTSDILKVLVLCHAKNLLSLHFFPDHPKKSSNFFSCRARTRTQTKKFGWAENFLDRNQEQQD